MITTRALFLSACLAALVTAGSGCGKKSKMVQNKGSDTMINLAQALAEEYRKVQPKVAIAVSGGGSGVGIAALENGNVDIANASRELKPAEREAVKKNTGAEPLEHIVAYDALAVYVHPSNPIASINQEQLACIYGEGGKCGKWTDLGVQVPGCSGQEIVRVSRQNNSGTYAYFREWVVGEKADLKLGSRDLSGSKDVVDLVTGTPCAIGYSGVGYQTSGVKVACVSKAAEPCVVASTQTALDGSYPLARPLYMYTRSTPTPEIKGYLDWIRSDAGQVVVERSGYAPLPVDKRIKTP
jgi:phosphate transport system substrate-binding protein